MFINEIIAPTKVGDKNLGTTIHYGATGASLRYIIKNRNDIRPIRKEGNLIHGVMFGASWHRIYVVYDPEVLKDVQAKEPDPERWMEKDLYNWIVGFMELTSARSGWKSFEVGMSWIQPALRGKGLGKEMYDTAVLHDGIILMSGTSQSTASQRIWQSMIRDNRYTVYAIDLARPEKPLPIDLQADYIDILSGDTSKKVYSRVENQIRLVAVKTE